ncbi:hypothetical protein GCM10009821_27140 [Aeromicrobium halocynthiae]|uniref:Glycosyltransferase family 1 protein n=2 Tax=Aeromicrobium halocynthiae TaxID=560557 RepID=A0ABN2W5R0_9ACTN
MQTEKYLVWEPGENGHLLVYCRRLVDYAIEQGLDLSVALSRDALGSEAYQRHFDSDDSQARAISISGQRNLLSLLRREGITTLIVPHADPLLHYLLFISFKKIKMNLLVMQDPQWEARTAQTALLRGLRLRLKQLFIMLLGRRPSVTLRKLGPPTSTSVKVVPDPVLISELDTTISIADLHLGVETFWFGIVGGISPHKNPMLVATALRVLAASTSRRIGLAFIGPISAELAGLESDARDLLAETSVEFISRDRILSNSEMNAVISQLDCVVMAYSTHAPNSTAWKAACIGTRFVAAGSSQYQLFAQLTERGIVVDLELASLVDAMNRALQSPPPEILPMPDDRFASRLLAP